MTTEKRKGKKNIKEEGGKKKKKKKKQTRKVFIIEMTRRTKCDSSRSNVQRLAVIETSWTAAYASSLAPRTIINHEPHRQRSTRALTKVSRMSHIAS